MFLSLQGVCVHKIFLLNTCISMFLVPCVSNFSFHSVTEKNQETKTISSQILFAYRFDRPERGSRKERAEQSCRQPSLGVEINTATIWLLLNKGSGRRQEEGRKISSETFVNTADTQNITIHMRWATHTLLSVWHNNMFHCTKKIKKIKIHKWANIFLLVGVQLCQKSRSHVQHHAFLQVFPLREKKTNNGANAGSELHIGIKYEVTQRNNTNNDSERKKWWPELDGNPIQKHLSCCCTASTRACVVLFAVLPRSPSHSLSISPHFSPNSPFRPPFLTLCRFSNDASSCSAFLQMYHFIACWVLNPVKKWSRCCASHINKSAVFWLSSFSHRFPALPDALWTTWRKTFMQEEGNLPNWTWLEMRGSLEVFLGFAHLKHNQWSSQF